MTDSTTQRLERLAVALTERFPAWKFSTTNLVLYGKPTLSLVEQTECGTRYTAVIFEGMSSLDEGWFVAFALDRLEELGAEEFIWVFGAFSGEPKYTLTMQADPPSGMPHKLPEWLQSGCVEVTGPTRAAALFEALCVALGVPAGTDEGVKDD